MTPPRPPPMDVRPDRDDLEALVSQQLLDTLDSVVKRKARCWAARASPSGADVAATITDCSSRNALIGSRSTMATAVSDVVAMVRNQARMVCDIAAALDKREIVTSELLFGVLLWSPGVTDVGPVRVHGGTVVVRRAAHGVLGSIAARLGARLVRSMTNRSLRAGGAPAIAAWARHATRWRGEQAVEVLSKDAELSDDEMLEPVEAAAAGEPVDGAPDLLDARVIALANLAKADRHIHEDELRHFEAALAGFDVSHAVAARIHAEMSSRRMADVDLSGFAQAPDEAIALMVDLISLAKRDGQIRPSERAYVQDVGTQIGYPDEDIAALLAG